MPLTNLTDANDVFNAPFAMTPWTIRGRGGNDQIRGNALDDTLYGDYGGLPVTGVPGDDELHGLGGNDSLLGGQGNDILDGGVGADTMTGGVGNDLYIVDDPGDIVTEAVNAGTDTVRSFISYTLPANVENLTLAGFANINGFGNALDNQMVGNAVDNLLIGNAGNDHLNGLAGSDSLFGGEGDDTLEGGFGIDRMTGGAGNDLYIVDHPGDIITEAVNAGTDAVRSSISYTLTPNVENLTLTGVADISGFGNALDNSLVGNSGDNFMAAAAGDDLLNGLGGNDTMRGGLGNDRLTGGEGADTLIGVNPDLANPGIGEVDTLIGGAGADRFILGTAAKVFYDDDVLLSLGLGDRAIITDFQRGIDKIQLKGSAANYVLQVGNFGGGAGLDTRIFINKPGAFPNELIGVVQNVSIFNLGSNNFVYV